MPGISRAARKLKQSVNPSTDTTLTELLRQKLYGRHDHYLDPTIPIVKLADRISNELLEAENFDWHLLDLVWQRFEGQVPAVIQSSINVQGVIALPIVSAGEIDWTKDAMTALAGPSRALPAADPGADALTRTGADAAGAIIEVLPLVRPSSDEDA